jgi:hypothetical protein
MRHDFSTVEFKGNVFGLGPGKLDGLLADIRNMVSTVGFEFHAALFSCLGSTPIIFRVPVQIGHPDCFILT